MNASLSQLQVVVGLEIDERCDWIPLPPEPWPRYVRLWRTTEAGEVALVVNTLATWGRESTKWSADALGKEMNGLPGGLAAVAQGAIIGPSCCCGLESWHEWLDVLTTGRSPWLGHDPAPFVEVLGDRVNVWADGGLGGQRRSHIAFARGDFEQALETAARDLLEFQEPLCAWLRLHAPEHADSVIARFRECFCTRPPDLPQHDTHP